MLFIKYNASNNTLQITNVKYITDTIIETETILYEHNNILLQKWNNLVLNYNSGTLDIFLNNILVKTIINFTNYVKYDSLLIGYNNGVYGDICNILYFKKSVDRDIIKLLYDLYKNLNPPCLDLKNVKKIV